MLLVHPRVWLLASILLLPQLVQAESNWPRWRGPHQNGHTTDRNIPTEWSTGTLTYKAPLPGIGQSTPVIWGDKVFLTTALDAGKQRVVFCADRNSGKILWQQVAWTGEPEKSHIMNGWASATCVTDGEMVYAFFGLGGLHAYTVDGKHVWSRDLGTFVSPWGVSACPILVDDLLIQNCDSEEDANICGINKKTGEVMWKTQRPNNRGWSTPTVVTVGDHQEAVVNGHSGVFAYEPKTGQQLWFCKSFNGRGEPTVTPAGDLLCVINGLSGDAYAIKPGGSGDVTASHMAWHTPRKTGRDCPSPIVIDDYMLVMDMKGVLTCYQPSTGKELWKERIGGNFSASPIAANGSAYFIDEAGTTYVIKPGEKMTIVATNKIEGAAGELFRASPTPSEGQLFLRSTTNLYVVGKRQK
ncbi:MAG: PQQ-binding-like beta-propeller repeat protein [Planctomycetaceae bacterium]|nr:PQQ-binding-like beta-propeller repeat protein [Planctomycetaceae bacterium]